jgi:hypothetical protein
MKRLFAVVIVLAILVVGVGFYRGWFTLSHPEAEKGSNKVNVNLTVDEGKMHEDAAAVKKKTTELTDNVTGRGKKADDHSTDDVKSKKP